MPFGFPTCMPPATAPKKAWPLSWVPVHPALGPDLHCERNQKAASLPSPVTPLKQRGYETSFIYGSDLPSLQAWVPTYVPWALARSVDGWLFPKSSTTQWGAHDEFIFQKAYKDTARKTHRKALLPCSTHPHQPRALWDPQAKKIASNDELS